MTVEGSHVCSISSNANCCCKIKGVNSLGNLLCTQRNSMPKQEGGYMICKLVRTSSGLITYKVTQRIYFWYVLQVISSKCFNKCLQHINLPCKNVTGNLKYMGRDTAVVGS